MGLSDSDGLEVSVVVEIMPVLLILSSRYEGARLLDAGEDIDPSLFASLTFSIKKFNAFSKLPSYRAMAECACSLLYPI